MSLEEICVGHLLQQQWHCSRLPESVAKMCLLLQYYETLLYVAIRKTIFRSSRLWLQ